MLTGGRKCSGFIPAFEKVGKNCHVYFTRDEVFLLQNAISNDGVQALAQFPKEVMFEEYVISSQNDNRIAFIIDLSLLNRALKSYVNTDGDRLQVKLVKKSPSPTERASPFLSFESKGYRSAIIQDVPISTPLSPLDVNDLQACIDLVDELPKTLVQLPPLVQLQCQIDRLKSLGEVLEVGVSQHGLFNLAISSSLISIGTEYSRLQIWGEKADPDPALASLPVSARLQKSIDDGKAVSAKVSTKHFARSLLCHLTKPEASYCGVTLNNSCLLLMFQYSESSVSLQYRLPVLESEEG